MKDFFLGWVDFANDIHKAARKIRDLSGCDAVNGFDAIDKKRQFVGAVTDTLSVTITSSASIIRAGTDAFAVLVISTRKFPDHRLWTWSFGWRR